MKKAESLFGNYRACGYLSPNGELYLHLATALDFIEDVLRAELAIIGVDFYHISDGRVVPVSPINSFDGSELLREIDDWQTIVSRSHEIVRNILQEEVQRDETQHCGFELVEETEWKK